MKNARKGRLTIRALRGGFTLIELMIVVAILGILAAVAFNLFEDIIRRSQEGTTKGNLGILRSSMAIYFGDNEQLYPTDDLTSLTVNGKYLALIPYVQTPTYHPGSRSVTTEISPTDTGNWSYDNVPSDSDFGAIFVGCTHLELHGNPWSSY